MMQGCTTDDYVLSARFSKTDSWLSVTFLFSFTGFLQRLVSQSSERERERRPIAGPCQCLAQESLAWLEEASGFDWNVRFRDKTQCLSQSLIIARQLFPRTIGVFMQLRIFQARSAALASRAWMHAPSRHSVQTVFTLPQIGEAL